MAKDYFRDLGIEFDDIDVSEDKFAAQQMIEKSGQMGVPVIEIGDKIIVGFDVPKIEESLKHSDATPQKKEETVYDVVIIGGSAAGLTAAIYAARREMKAIVLTKDIGGQISRTALIENYSGIEKIQGPDLVKVFEKQVRDFGVEIVMKEVTKVSETESNGRKMFSVFSGSDEYKCRSVVVANGKTPRNLNVSGEEEFRGKGVSYCATCDAPLFKDKIVAVVGGGNSALDAALLLCKISKKVYLIHRRKEFRAFENVVQTVKGKCNVEFVLDSSIKEIKGDTFVNSIVIEDKSGNVNEIAVDGVFVEIGSEVDVDFVKELVGVDGSEQIKTSKNAETSHPGIFAAGDVTDTPFKQIIVACGEGCKAALAAYNYINGFDNKYVADWSSHTHNKDGTV